MSYHTQTNNTSRKDRYYSKIAFQRLQLDAIDVNDTSSNVLTSEYREKVFSLFLLYNRVKHIHASSINGYEHIDFNILDDNKNKLCLLELKSRKKGLPFGDIPYYSIEYDKLNFFKKERMCCNGYKHFIVVYEFCYNNVYEYYASNIDPHREYEVKYITNKYTGKVSKKFKVPIENFTKLDMDNLKYNINYLLLE